MTLHSPCLASPLGDNISKEGDACEFLVQPTRWKIDI